MSFLALVVIGLMFVVLVLLAIRANHMTNGRHSDGAVVLLYGLIIVLIAAILTAVVVVLSEPIEANIENDSVKVEFVDCTSPETEAEINLCEERG